MLPLAEAASYLRLPEAHVIDLVHSQGLPGRCIATEWRFLKVAIQRWLTTASPAWEARKAGILELAGKYKEDPDLERCVPLSLRVNLPSSLAGADRQTGALSLRAGK